MVNALSMRIQLYFLYLLFTSNGSLKLGSLLRRDWKPSPVLGQTQREGDRYGRGVFNIFRKCDMTRRDINIQEPLSQLNVYLVFVYSSVHDTSLFNEYSLANVFLFPCKLLLIKRMKV